MNTTTSSSLGGLSPQQVQERIARGDINQASHRAGRTYWQIVRENVFNLFNVVLFTLLLIVLYYRDWGTLFFAGASVVSNTFIGMLQEISAKRQLDQLAQSAAGTVTVWRDGTQQTIAQRDIVLDDLLEIHPGDRAVVDAVVVQSDALEMDEALLTGESDAVPKANGDTITSGSFCTAGTGLLRATAVGSQTTLSRITREAATYSLPRTPTQIKLDIIVELTIVVMLLFVPLLLLADLVAAQPRLTTLEAVRNSVVFVTTLVPQGLVLTAILSLTLAALKISQQNTLVQRANAVESLANATVLCFDKTGTLTENRLQLVEVISFRDPNASYALSRDILAYTAALAHRNRTAEAIHSALQDRHEVTPLEKDRELSFSAARQWGAIHTGDILWILGAPERLLIAESEGAKRAASLSADGFRVLAFVRQSLALTNPVPQQVEPTELEPLGLIVLRDRVRDDIRQILDSFRQQNISLKVISGDHDRTVRAVAHEAGIQAESIVTGPQLRDLNDERLRQVVRETNVFARIDPNTKRRIVTALRANDEYVAMIGDGVNDVPALKQANLAIVMNDGVQISKDIADIILLDNDLATLPRAFAEGTETTQTIYATARLFLIRGFYNVVMILGLLFAGLPFPITPVQLMWATFTSVNLPASLIALGFVRPRPLESFRDDVLTPILQAGFIGASTMIVLFAATYLGLGRNLGVAQAALTIYMMGFNALLVLDLQGVDAFQPATFRRYARSVLVMLLLIPLSVLLMYAAPPLFEFTPPPVESFGPFIALIAAQLGLSLFLLALTARKPYFVRRLWQLIER